MVFYPTQFTLTAQLIFQTGPQDVALADLVVSSDASYLQYAAGTWRVSLAAPYGGYIRTAIRLTYTQPGTQASVQGVATVTIVDVRDVSVQTYFPVGNPPASRALSRLQCTQEFQQLRIVPQALVDGVGYLPIPVGPGLDVLVYPPGVAYADGLQIIGQSPGTFTVYVEWYGYARTVTDVQVLDASVTATAAYTSDSYDLSGYPGEVFPLSLTLEMLGADGHTQFSIPDIFQDPLWPQWVQVVAPPCVAVQGAALVLVSNCPPGAQVVFRLNQCPNITVVQRQIATNILPTVGDLDIRGASVLLNASGVEGFYLELATDWPVTDCLEGEAWRGPWACTLNDPPGIVRIAGVGPPVDGLVELAVLLPAWNATYVLGRLELVGSEHTHTTITAGSQGNATIAWPYHASMPLLDITTALRQFRCAMVLACPLAESLVSVLVLAHQQRIVDSTAFYSDDMELSLLIRLLDANGDPAEASVYALIQTSALPPLAGSTPTVTPLGLYIQANPMQDGWYGLEWRESMPVLPNTSVAWGIQTFDAYNGTSPTRLQTLGVIPYPPFAQEPEDRRALLDVTGYASSPIGVRQPLCPHSAAFQAVIVNHYTAQVTGQATPANLARLGKRIACAASAVPRRVTASLAGDALMLTVATESFLRAYRANFIVSDLLETCLRFASLTQHEPGVGPGLTRRLAGRGESHAARGDTGAQDLRARPGGPVAPVHARPVLLGNRRLPGHPHARHGRPGLLLVRLRRRVRVPRPGVRAGGRVRRRLLDRGVPRVALCIHGARGVRHHHAGGQHGRRGAAGLTGGTSGNTRRHPRNAPGGGRRAGQSHLRGRGDGGHRGHDVALVVRVGA